MPLHMKYNRHGSRLTYTYCRTGLSINIPASISPFTFAPSERAFCTFRACCFYDLLHHQSMWRLLAIVEYKKGLLPKQKTLLFFATCRNEVLQGKTKLLVDELLAVLDNKTLSIACHFLTEKVECSTLVSCLRSIDV